VARTPWIIPAPADFSSPAINPRAAVTALD
jgi:hypothetical protein